MSVVEESEAYLLRRLRDAPSNFHYQYTPEAEASLLRDLFNAMALNRREYFQLLFPNGHPQGADAKPEDWQLSAAQGGFDGAEYTPAARGKRCGHIFKTGEATYRCKNCAVDDTCVLCSRCYDASDHEGHTVYFSISPGGSGCCDCGDDEAWTQPVKCAIHTAPDHTLDMDADEDPQLAPPEEMLQAIRSTIARALDYVVDVISCSPEQLRLKKTVKDIQEDERQSRLTASYYGEEDEADNIEYSVLLWNDEKHTVQQVQEQVARACKESKRYGYEKAMETDAMGRSLIARSTDLHKLLEISRIIEQIKVTVTIRSSRDTFREQMCGTIIGWLDDISRCSVGSDSNILRMTICQELLGVWRVGSKASNTEIGKMGIDDHGALDENEIAAENRFAFGFQNIVVIEQPQQQQQEEEEEEEEEEDDADVEMEVETGTNMDEGGDGAQDDEDDVEMAGMNTAVTTGGIMATINSLLSGVRPNFDQEESPPSEQPSDQVMEDDEDTGIPRIPKTPHRPPHVHPSSPAPWYWTTTPQTSTSRQLPPYEDLRQRVRLDWLIMFDLRLWKRARNELRDLYISTVITIPEFKRILGLRFAGLYTPLAELYLVADREPEHSITCLSLQMLTTPSITQEVVQKANFLTTLMAILYTFLTTRQVGYPSKVNTNAMLAFDGGQSTNPLTNRRLFHFFHDLRHMLQSEFVQQCLRNEPRYTLQFLDLVRLHQGICPNTRAVAEHVEYEADAWLSAASITREINKLVRLFASAFRWDGQSSSIVSLQEALTATAKYATLNSMGWEHNGGSQYLEMKSFTDFKKVNGLAFGHDYRKNYKIVKFAVEKDPISFHHALHYTLSWLIEAGKDLDDERLRSLIMLNWSQVRSAAPIQAMDHEPDDLALALFDIPLRVCVWLAQMKTGMWVRNGFSLKHQMSAYRSVSQRDLTHNRDIFLLQVAMVVLNPELMLVNMVDRFGLMHWMKGQYKKVEDFDEVQILDLAEDFLHLLIVILSERLPLLTSKDEPELVRLKIKRDLIHVLCFKPMQFSELSRHLPERTLEHDLFQEVLQTLTTFRPPDGLSDYGQFALKEEFLDEVDPYIANFSKNQREETEGNYRARIAKKTARKETDVVYAPTLRPIRHGLFQHLSKFTGTRVFAHIINRFLEYALRVESETPTVAITRCETFLNLCLHLCQLAVSEDKTTEHDDEGCSFIKWALEMEPPERAHDDDKAIEDDHQKTIAEMLYELAEKDTFKACRPKILHILRSMKKQKPEIFAMCATYATEINDSLGADESNSEEAEAERKKLLAKERQAKIMAQMKAQQQSFMDTSGFNFDDEDLSDEEIDETLPTAETKMWKYPTGTCILCQEEMNDSKLYGTLTMVTESNILRQTDLKDPEYLFEPVIMPDNLDRSAQDIRPFGVASMNLKHVTKMASDGSHIKVEQQGLGRGYPRDQCKRGPVATGCSHLMHFSCFEHYYELARRRHPNQVARSHPETLERKEFVCPLCKALGNAFLPIIWKGMEETTNTALAQHVEGFEDWVASLGADIDQPGIVAPGSDDQIDQMFSKYGEEKVVGTISSQFEELARPVDENLPSLDLPGGISLTLTALAGGAGAALEGFANALQAGGIGPNLGAKSQAEELRQAYQRLRDTYHHNNLKSEFEKDNRIQSSGRGDLSHVDVLVQTFGFSVSAVEIAQRGVTSEAGSTLLDTISSQSLLHLRILSETITSYLALGAILRKSTVPQFQRLLQDQKTRLFIGNHKVFDEQKAHSNLLLRSKPLLSDDIFVFLAETSLCLAPSMKWEIMHLMRLCYIAQIVQVMVVLSQECDLVNTINRWKLAPEFHDIEGRIGYTEDQLTLIRKFQNLVKDQISVPNMDVPQDSFTLALIRHLLEAYITPFLRKCVIMMHTRYGILFPPSGFAEAEDPELDRLTTSLCLPTIDSILTECLADDNVGSTLRDLIAGWCNHARERKMPITVSHPAIFELVALPKNFDVLVEESTRRHCPTKGPGYDIVDPSICLFCGEIFCSQASCCLKDRDGRKLGGCNQHIRKCGGSVGLFINIRKCALFYLHNFNGTWSEAPYMDVHGETDIGLRRNRQLFLNQRRYDAWARDVWLRHGIPSIISRRLEAEMNNGGWDTL